MNEQVTLYTNPMSRGRIVHWLLEELNAPYELKILDWQKQDHKSPAYLAINPMGKIPAIVHKNVVVTETAAICAYLADAFSGAGLAPAANDPARGTYYRWLFFAVNCVEPALVDKKFPRTQSPEQGHIGYGTLADTLRTLDGAIANGFLLGDRFSAADVYLASLLGWALMNKDLEATPAMQQYLARCTERPAYQRMVAQAGAIG